ncbi:MAG: isoprenylcysteine carboxylmethyltransferase family protein [Pseudomonadota bacterium]
MHIPPPLIALTLAGAMWLLNRLPFAGRFELPASELIAGIVLASGVAVAVAGVLEFRRHRTTVNPIQLDKASALVTSGIFRLTRNPMYLGLLLVLLGVGAWLSSLLPFVAAALFVPTITVLQIRPEEATMQHLFGDEYTAYRQRTRRWL